ncbi:MAG: glycosyl hydrolase, partial [Bacteroidetes bacterium]
INTPHGDHHDLWIAPEDPARMIVGDDGGAQVTFDGGDNWSTYYNQPTAQYYRVTTDDYFPYRIYVAQQDNSTQRVFHRTDGGSIGERDWEPTAGCECGHIAIDPKDPDIVYGGCYDGVIERRDHKNKQSRGVNVWPDNPMGHGAEGMKYRFQWNFPIFFSPHDPNKLYTASNHLHVSYNGGESWEIISPDLTRNDPSKLGPSGGPITKDNTSVEYYCTIFAAMESPRVKGLIWTGSDDGLVHVTRDGGQNWENVTPPDMPEWIMINSLEPDPHLDGGCYIAATMYKHGDFRPYLYKTKDFGKTWTKIVRGIDDEHFTRVIRADPHRPGLLYAGTESGVYISFDDGAHWQPFQLNLPIVPITDLTIKNDNLIAATQGRSIWMIDDLTVLHQINDEVARRDHYLYKPMPSWRMGGFQRKKPRNAGKNHPGGVMVHYFFKEKPADSVEVKLSFHEADGDLIKAYSTTAKDKKSKLEIKEGGNRFVWNMRYPDAKDFKGMIMWAGSMAGPRAVPGKYLVRLTVGGEVQEQEFEILKDPRSTSTPADFEQQFAFLMEVRDKVSEAHEAIIEIRAIRDQIDQYTKRVEQTDANKPLFDKAKEIKEQITEVEEALYQTKNRSRQDPLNFPIRLTNKLAYLNSLVGRGDFPPTEQARAVKKELTEKIDAELDRFYKVKAEQVPAFNNLVRHFEIDAILLDKPDKTVN